MTPEKLERLRACIQEAASILYEETNAANLQDFESLELTVRQHFLDYIGPEMALFLSSKSLAADGENSASLKAV